MIKFEFMARKQFTVLLLALGIMYVGCIGEVWAQDPQFSQFYNAPLYLNPSFTGATNSNRIILNHRLQWPNLPQTFATYTFSYDIMRPELRSGFGILVSTDKAGSASLRTTNIDLMYAYKIQYGDRWVMTPSIYFGYGLSSIDLEKLLLGDQLEFGNGTAPTLDPAIAALGNTSYFDIGTGFLMYSARHWLGLSAYHINRPNVSLLEAESRLPVRWNLHGGTRIPLNRGFNPQPTGAALVPYFQFRKQGSIEQFDLGLNYVIPPLTIGLMYRGVPFLTQQSNPPDGSNIGNQTVNPSTDALVFMLGMQISNFQFAYSFDFTISTLGSESGGAHEISLIWEFQLLNPRHVKRRVKQIPCPTFNTAKGGVNPFRKR